MNNKELLKINMSMGMLLMNAHRGMCRRFVQNAQELGFDISLDQWMVLGPISQEINPTHKFLSEFCLKDKASITRIIDTLEKRSLVVRVADQLDQRIKRVVLTQEGKELFNNIAPIMEKTRKEVKQDISDDEIEAFKQVLVQINVNINSENG
tara:strand:+ start:245 stop:700 length:456 start_codon:yes stop_codon:yes gene_type:complete